MQLRDYIFILLVIGGYQLYGQTFSRTYKDTFALSALPGGGGNTIIISMVAQVAVD